MTDFADSELSAPASCAQLPPQETLQPLCEAMLFAAGEPLPLTTLQAALGRYLKLEGEEAYAALGEALQAALAALTARWPQEAPAAGFYLAEVAAGYQFRSRPCWGAAIRHLREGKPSRLSKPALETLAVIAYHQPASKPDIDHLRGVDCATSLKQLLERGLIVLAGRKQEPGRPVLYATSEQFLSFFELNSLADLPPLRDLRALEADSEGDAQEILDIAALEETAKSFQLGEEPALTDLEDAVANLSARAKQAQQALADEGIEIDLQGGSEGAERPAPAAEAEGTAQYTN